MGIEMPHLRSAGARTYIACVLLAVLCVYANGLNGVFHFDDEHSLIDNPHVRSLAEIGNFIVDPQMFSRNVGSQMYRPLVLTSYALNYSVDGYEPLGYQLFNLFVHGGVTTLIFLVFVRLGVSPAAAATGAVFFGVHPLTSEPVNYISARAESMAVLFYLASLYFYLRAHPRLSVASILLLACGLASKAIVVTLPLLLFAIERWLYGRKLRDVWGRILPYAIVVAVYLLATRQIVGEALVSAPLRSFSQQIATQIKACIYYMHLFAVPYPLSIEHQFFVAKEWGEGAVLASLFFLLSLAGLLLRFCRSRSWIYFWFVWVSLAMLPTWIVPLNVLVNERRLYLPLAGLIGAVVWAGSVGRFTVPRWVLPALGITLAALTVQRNALWASEKALWQDASAHAPLMPRPYLRIGMLLRAEGDLAAAEKSYLRVLEVDPDYAPAYNNLGNLQGQRGQLDEAIYAYEKALVLWPSYAEAMINLASAHSKKGDYERAEELFMQALPLSPQREEIYNNLATNYLRTERYNEAETALRRALELEGSSARIYYNLGGAIEGQGRLEEALRAYEMAVRIQPSYAPAHGRLGDLYTRLGYEDQARRAYEAFLSNWRGAPDVARVVRRRLEEMGP
jgi:protein O-mannosyl-transferase